MPERDQTLQDIYRLTRENNRMLRAMRRGAFLSGIFRLAFWIFILGSSYWAYQTYLAPILEQTVSMMQEVQGANAAVQAQFGDLQGLLDKLPSF